MPELLQLSNKEPLIVTNHYPKMNTQIITMFLGGKASGHRVTLFPDVLSDQGTVKTLGATYYFVALLVNERVWGFLIEDQLFSWLEVENLNKNPFGQLNILAPLGITNDTISSIMHQH